MTRTPKIGEIIHYHATVEATFPAIINTVEGDGAVSLNVFTPGAVEHLQSIPYSETPTAGCWTWPPAE